MIKKGKKDFFGEGKEKLKAGKKIIAWDWEHFQSTKGFPISKNLLDWVIGQDPALSECYLCLDEWIYKLNYLKREKFWRGWASPEEFKPIVREKLSPGPYLLLLGDPGTGKSLIGRALSMKLTQLYKEHKINLMDVVCWKNKIIPGEPKISVHPSPKGKKLVRIERIKVAKKARFKSLGIKLIQGLLIGLGTVILGLGFYWVLMPWILNIVPFGSILRTQEIYDHNFLYYLTFAIPRQVQLFMAGGMMLFTGIFVAWIGRMLGGNFGAGGIGGAQSTDAPKILIDNSGGRAPFIDATGHSSAQLFGSIAWDPYQTGGLGTPEHQRTTAGDVHRASLGILYIDEIKNLHPAEAITLLTVLEDGQLPITLRARWSEGGTAAMAVSTEPVPTVTFLVAAGNFDSIPMIHPALMDRIYGYGKVVRMNNDMPNTIAHRRKYVQFISQEIKRFNLIPFSRDACIELTEEGRRRSNKRNALSTKFRPLISIIKTAAILAINEGKKIVEAKHVKEAIEHHCKTIQKQILEHYMEEKSKFRVIECKGKKLGETYGLAVVTDPGSGEMTGSVLRVKAQMIKKKSLEDFQGEGYYEVSGISKDATYIGDSVSKVRSIILHKYRVDIAQDYMTHIDFSQSYGVDGPSAGVTMVLALCSLLEGKPLRQDVAVTGEINISSNDEIEITPIGGTYEKILAAEKLGFKKVIIPFRNYKHSIDPKDFKIEIISGKNLSDYLKVLLS